jgi:hypothetical protein
MRRGIFMARKKKEKVIHHRGMTMTAQEHEQWHKKHKKMTPQEHEQLMEKMGISPEEDEKWHREQKGKEPHAADSDARPLNPFAIGGGFLAYCVKQGWLITEGKGPKAKYFPTEKGRLELAKFDIKI